MATELELGEGKETSLTLKKANDDEDGDGVGSEASTAEEITFRSLVKNWSHY